MKEVKRISKLLLAFILLLSLTGCVKMETTMEIGKDKKMTFTMIQVIDENAIKDLMNGFDSTDSDITAEENSDDLEFDDTDTYEDDADASMDDDYEKVKAKLEPYGYTVEKYQEDSMSGYKITRNIDSIDDVSKSFLKVQDLMSIDEDSFDHTHFFQKSSNLFKETYTASYKFDMVDEETEDVDDSYYDMYASSFDLKFIVKLPNKSLSNNATSVSEDGKTLTWDLKLGQENEVNFMFDLTNQNMLYITYGALGIVLILLLIVIVVVINKKKGKKGPEVKPVAPVAPAPEVKPVAPVTPVAPVQEVKPVAPVTPVTPVQEVKPVAPVVPVQEVKPVTPVTPVQEVKPVTPVQEVKPVAPVTPVPEVKPVEPTNNNLQ